ncbi:hypothetical protein [Rufibacter latericius]|uniref:Uncharacterized protein n=1 Tax=Rufibacter latericius TaxID=2487040 RepID=A0A3M9MD73_9BACT|nr:hypothetical protein [Rufibacter latericius]RNI22538.1 hypothetical protein EFB08_20785 [Rufibacter latericius]
MRLRTEVKLLLSAAFVFFIQGKVSAQKAENTAETPSSSASFPVSLYQKATKEESHLLNGPEYVDIRRANHEGHPFFFRDEKTLGNVHYDGATYEEVPLLYNLVTDEVILYRNGLLLQKLVKEKLASFQLNGHQFIRLEIADTTTNTPLRTGFYDVMHDGNTKLLVKRQKEKQDLIVDQKLLERFTSIDKFYIQQGPAYHQVKSGRSVYNVFSDQKKELKKYARSKKLKFRKQREESILALVLYYDSLKK